MDEGAGCTLLFHRGALGWPAVRHGAFRAISDPDHAVRNPFLATARIALPPPPLHGNEAIGLSHSPVGHWTQIIAASEPPLMSPLSVSSIEEEEEY